MNTYFHCLGISHKSANLAFRERIYLDEVELARALPPLAQRHQIQELLLLSTCNRLELYTFAPNQTPTTLYRIYTDIFTILQKPPPSPTELQHYSYLKHAGQAISHIFAVAASLDSMVVGETQITGQFKKALQLAAKSGTLGPHLDRLGQEVLATNKQIRNHTKISSKTVSLSHTAIDLSRRVFRNPSDCRFLFLGAGQMIQLAARYTASLKPKQIQICNRSLENAQDLAASIGGTAHSLSEFPTLLTNTDILISCTANDTYSLNYQGLKGIMAHRPERAIFIADIAIPRDVDPKCTAIDGVYLFDLDDLQQVVTSNRQDREQEAAIAQEIAGKRAQRFEDWLKNSEMKPVLKTFRYYLDEVIDQEANRTLHKIPANHHQSIKIMLDTIGKRLVADAAKTLLKSKSPGKREQASLVLQGMFSPTSTQDPKGVPSKTTQHRESQQSASNVASPIRSKPHTYT